MIRPYLGHQLSIYLNTIFCVLCYLIKNIIALI